MDIDNDPPSGLLIHTAGRAENGAWRIFDVWESQEACERFDEARLLPALARGLRGPGAGDAAGPGNLRTSRRDARRRGGRLFAMPRASTNGIELEYETFGDQTKPAMLLIMGLGVQMLGWDERFCNMLVDRGFFVIRFDNRDVGLSTHTEGPIPNPLQLLAQDFSSATYTLDDMADDTAGLLDELGIAAAHVIGVVDGRHDRADARGQAPGPGAVACVDHVDDRQQRGGSAEARGDHRAGHPVARRPGRIRRRGCAHVQRDRLSGLPARPGASARPDRRLVRPLPRPDRRPASAGGHPGVGRTAPRWCARSRRRPS